MRSFSPSGFRMSPSSRKIPRGLNYLLSRLGKEVVRRYYEWQLRGPHDVVAVGAFIGIENELVGFCFGGVFRGAMSGFLKKNRFFLVWRAVTHPWIVFDRIYRGRIKLGIRLIFNKPKRLLILKGPSRKLSKEPFTILSIGTALQYQCKGIGRMLMEHIESVASERGFTEMCLTVLAENKIAIRFYENLGWEKVLQDGRWLGTMKKLINPRC